MTFDAKAEVMIDLCKEHVEMLHDYGDYEEIEEIEQEYELSCMVEGCENLATTRRLVKVGLTFEKVK